jgi:LysR family transcriptional regulator, nitrogen assimilation regulatory protein
LDTRRLDAFVKIVDLGSVTRAAAVLRIAQPALSQQIAALEAEFKAKLLVRSTKGVTPTPAGLVLYRYARSIHRQLQEAQRTILDASSELTGSVALGLAPWSSASLIGPRLLRTVREQYPGILLHICDIFGITFSELTLRGRMDLAVLYGDAAPRGLLYRTVGVETFHVVARSDLLTGVAAEDPLSVEGLARLPLILPTEESFLRQMVERACASAGTSPQIVAEVYSTDMLSAALTDGIGATVLPRAVARSLIGHEKLKVMALEPAQTMPISLCIPDSAGLSDAAFAVHELVASALSELLD